MLTYLEQIEHEAAETGVDIVKACREAGVAKTTLQRWRNGQFSPSEATARAVIDKIKAIAGHAEPERAA